MAAQTLLSGGIQPLVLDAMASPARKFLQAGRGGLNLTHSETYADFCSRYGEHRQQMQGAVDAFTPDDLQAWVKDLGFDTFVGSSGRIYPRDKKAAPLLRTWLHRLKAQGAVFKMHHRWMQWQGQSWAFDTPEGQKSYTFDGVILALGGASWPHLGSTGQWLDILQAKGLAITPFAPANMGFDVAWSEHFRQKFAGTPLKNVQLSVRDAQGKSHNKRGEMVITDYGVEGSLIYAFSAMLRQEFLPQQSVTITLDLRPDQSLQQLTQALGQARGRMSLSSFWRRLGLSAIHMGLLYETLPKTALTSPGLVAMQLKNLPLTLSRPRPLAEAISTAGGLAWQNLNGDYMLKDYPGVFCAGEMLDWEAPTGGYLINGVMAQGQAAARGLLRFLQP